MRGDLFVIVCVLMCVSCSKKESVPQTALNFKSVLTNGFEAKALLGSCENATVDSDEKIFISEGKINFVKNKENCKSHYVFDYEVDIDRLKLKLPKQVSSCPGEPKTLSQTQEQIYLLKSKTENEIQLQSLTRIGRCRVIQKINKG